MFLGWYDPDRKYPVASKVADALDRYRQKFGRKATVCLLNPADAEGIAAAKVSLPVKLQAADYIPRNTFYVGTESSTQEQALNAA